MTWNDFCWHDWEGASCWYAAVVIVLVIFMLMTIVAEVLVRLTGGPRWLQWLRARWWFDRSPRE
jgi:hypothetical protein